MEHSKYAPLQINDIRSKYKVIDKVGKGTYGTVFKVLNLKDNKYYAIKKFQNTEAKLQVEGFPITALRQISLLKQLNHPNIVNLQQIICSKPNKRNLYRGSTFMVFEYMHHDFAGLFRSKVKFTLPQIKSIMKQLIEGCGFLHQNKVMHRDIKSANILMNDQGIVQLADFGLGRRTRFDSVYTYKVVTLWYRAPELLLGCKTYNHKVDVWSIGCVFAEFLTGEVLFKKETEYAIIQKIYEICGDLEANEFTQEYLRGCVYYNDMKPKKGYKNTLSNYIRKVCPDIDPVTIEFLQGLLELNPYRRLSCEQALNHAFFKRQPKPCGPDQIQKLDVQYHQMFRDRSLKIQRKERKASLNWSQEEEERRKKKDESKEQKNPRAEERGVKQHYKNDRDRYYDRNLQQNRHPTHRNDRYNEAQYNYAKTQKTLYSKKYDQHKPRRKYSRSQQKSRSSSSSSSFQSRRSRTRDKKHRYETKQRSKPYRIDSQNYEKEKAQISSKKQHGNAHYSYSGKDRQRYRQSQKDRKYDTDNDTKAYDTKAYGTKAYDTKGYDTKGYDIKAYDTKGYDTKGYDTKGYGTKAYDTKGYDTNGYDTKGYDTKGYDTKGYERERKNQSYKKDPSYKEERRQEDRNNEYKEKDRRQVERKQSQREERRKETYRESSKYKKEDYHESNSKYPPKQKYSDEGKSRPYKNQRDQAGQYRSKDDQRSYQKEQTDRHSRTYPSRDSKQYSRKQYPSTQRHKDDRRHQESPPKYRQSYKDRQYREYGKSSYEYQRKQFRTKDDSRYESRTYKNVSIQRQSSDRRKYSPKKNMDVESYR